MPLNIIKSNRMEKLLDAAAERLSRPLAGLPLAHETVILQSRGMQRWFSMEMARRFGIWANVDYPFPNRFVSDLFRQILPEVEHGTGYEPEPMRWQLMQILPTLLDRAEFAPVRQYLAGDKPEVRLYQLCGEIADLFDQYTLFRGAMLTEWEKGRGEGWQPLLWRALTASTSGAHREKLRQLLLKKLHKSEVIPSLPERISLFGISTLPPYHMDIFAALADRLELNIFILHPCEAYWGDLRRSDSQQADELSNPLLASMGRLGRDFANLLLEYDHVSGTVTDLYEPLPRTSMLHHLQGDILALQCKPLAPAMLQDRSILIHSCHSRMREIEVLHDSLLEMFEQQPGLQPRDILVMTPDIDAYAPYIAAVFEAESDPVRRIPFTVADRSIMADNRCANAFLSILAIGESRFEAPLIIDILSVPEVAAAFNFAPADLVQIRSWLEATRIRWGLDGEHRAALGLPCYGEQSWQSGIDRLLLGIAMPDEGQLFAGTLPFDAMEGESVATLGKLTEFLEALSALADQAAAAMTVDRWRELCAGLLERFFSERQQSDSQLPALRESLDTVCRVPVDAGYTEPLTPRLFRSMLTADLTNRRKGLGFMTGGVTFCAMLPMRSIPFRVIAMIGMDDGVFPRRDRSSGFDLIAADPLPGDRSLRNEDRYLFLESLISARELLHISYIGQGERDNAVYPPSVLVSELLDYLQNGLEEMKRESSSLVTRHRLQPFSRAYFSGDSRLFSYSEENYQGLLSAVARGGAPAGFCPVPLPPVDDSGMVTIEALVRFFSNPAAAFLASRLGILIEEFREGLEGRESFALDNLDNYQLKQTIAASIIKGDDPAALLPVVRGMGLLPPAATGELVFNDALSDALIVAERVSEIFTASGPMEPLDMDFEAGGRRVIGRLQGVRESALVRYRCGKFSGKDAVRCWIEHLCLNAVGVPGYPQATQVVSQDLKPFSLAPIAEPLQHLGDLITLYLDGLQRPLPFFPNSSYEYAKTGKLGSAKKKWSDEKFPESADRSFKAVFGDTDPLHGEFQSIATTVFAPFLAARGKD